MSQPRLVLASASPRRRSLLEAAGFAVEVQAPNADETWPAGSLTDGAMAIAARKLAKVASGDALTVAADTVVALGGRVMGKPADAAEATAMLTALSGKMHEVITGYGVRRGPRQERGAVVTQVTFRPLAAGEIARYVATGEPMDKAGAYGIQGEGGALVDSVRGSYTNIVGLPLAEVLAAIAALA